MTESAYGPRGEHLAWCKQRALAYLDRGDLKNAMASFGSDMRKHPQTDTDAVGVLLGLEGTRCYMSGDSAGMRRLIEGFN